ncbi:MAG: hypothetical protein ABJ263_18125 [Tateyamaria sp.]|uniref:hypothetical protein n=1 Tax=Tateyamaria sp. TaxID=1929288 RepID=UPI00326CD264
MNFARDIEAIEGVVIAGDPAFESVPPNVLNDALLALKAQAQRADTDAFMLAAMKLVALAGNGHSRVIPNAAIAVVPRRIVIRDGHPSLVEDGRAHRILAVDGIATEQLLTAWDGLLAGNAARRRLLSGIMMAWPAALQMVGAGQGKEVRYRLVTGADLVVSTKDCAPALDLYPVAETGALDPQRDDYALPDGSVLVWHDGLWWWRIADLKTLEIEQVTRGVSQMSEQPGANVVIDLRGNPGGSFLNAMPLIDWLRGNWRGERCAVLVDAYTFSAAIVTAALLAHHLGMRAQLIGADMGDDLAFFAEGGTIVLQDTGAHLRHSTARHDWETGQIAVSTPPEIAEHLVAAGPLRVTQIESAKQEQTAVAFVREA